MAGVVGRASGQSVSEFQPLTLGTRWNCDRFEEVEPRPEVCCCLGLGARCLGRPSFPSFKFAKSSVITEANMHPATGPLTDNAFRAIGF